MTYLKSRVYAALVSIVLLGAAGCQSPHHPVPGQAAGPFTSIELREGDILKISFPGAPNLASTQQIRRDGKVVLPMGGDLRAAGLTPSQLEEELLKVYGQQLVSKQAVVTVETSVYDVFVTGAVLKPGKVAAVRPISALEAIMEAGGFDYAKANTERVSIIRHDRNEVRNYKLNLKAMLQEGVNRTFYLRPSDIIYVPEKFSFF